MDESTRDVAVFIIVPLILGLAGLLLPLRWNPLQLRGGLARHVPESIAKWIPRVLGVWLLMMGLASLVLELVLGLGVLG